MTMFSEMLREMDRNTIRYMVDDMKEKIEKGKVELSVIEGKLTETEGKLAEAEKVIGRKDEELLEKDAEIARLQALLKEK